MIIYLSMDLIKPQMCTWTYSINQNTGRANPDTLIGRLELGHCHDVMFDKLHMNQTI